MTDENFKMEITDLGVSDASIRSLRSMAEKLIVELVDWEESVWSISFYDVIAFKNFNIENEELSNIQFEESDDFLQEASLVLDEPLNMHVCIKFYTAWHDKPLLKIIAKSWEIKEKL